MVQRVGTKCWDINNPAELRDIIQREAKEVQVTRPPAARGSRPISATGREAKIDVDRLHRVG